MRIKWTEISTVYAGPFSKHCDLGALRKLFKSFGPVRSMSLVLETHQVASPGMQVLTSFLGPRGCLDRGCQGGERGCPQPV